MTDISITLGEAQEAVNYWLNNAVLRESVGVASVRWDALNNVFIISIEPEKTE